MIDERQVQGVLQQEIYPVLLHDRSGFVARPGFGTYRQFLARAGLREPFSLPATGTPAYAAFLAECARTARQVVNVLRHAGAVDLIGPHSGRVGVIDGKPLHRVAKSNAGPKSLFGPWWFRDSVLRETCAEARVRNGQLLPPPLFRLHWKETLRQRLAIRYDWNSIDQLLTMRTNLRFPAVFAIGLAQPTHTNAKDAPILRGGVEQVWLPWTPLVRITMTDPVDLASASQ